MEQRLGAMPTVSLFGSAWTVSVHLGTTVGSTRTVFGTTLWRVSGVVQLLRYL